MNEYKLLVQRIGLITLLNIFSNLSGIILLPVLTKNMPVEEYGIWSQVNITIGLASIIILLGLPHSMVRFMAAMKERNEIRERFYSILSIIFVMAILASIAFYYFSGTLAALLFGNNIAITRLLPVLILIESINAILYNYFRTFQRMKVYSFFTFIGIYLSIALAYYFVSLGGGIYGAVIGLLLSKFILFLVMISLIIVEIGISIPMFRNIRDYLAFGLPLVPSGLSDWVINSSDRYVISIFLGTAYVGYYSPGYLLGNIIVMFIYPIGCVLPVELAKHFDENKKELVETILNRSLKYFLVFAIPATFGLTILSKTLLSILSTPDIADQGYMITPFVALGMVLFGITSIVSNIIALIKRTTISCTIWFIAALSNLGLTLFLVPRIGIVGAAAATLIAFFFALLLTTYYSQKFISLRFDYIYLLKILAASLLMSAMLIILSPGSLVEILLAIILCAAVYFFTLFVLKALGKEEINFLKNLFCKTA